MAENKQPSTVDIEEGSAQGTYATSSKSELVSDQEKDPITILWPSSAKYEYCCIYRVPCRLRSVNPEAYTPQMLLIGPLQHYKKAQADDLSKTDCRNLGYLKMERQKEKYLENFAHKYGEQTVDELRRIIKRDEEIIRACYAEATDSIKSEDFVKMMLLDSVFILVCFMQFGPRYMKKTGDFIIDEPSHQDIIMEDLILLENQLPYLLLENLFDPFLNQLEDYGTCRDLILKAFGFEEKIKEEVKFLHFTDLIRRVRVLTLGLTEEQEIKEKHLERYAITSLHNAEKLDSAGVEFVADTTDNENEGNISLMIKFERGILKIPCFAVEYDTESYLRNIMALEQCHYIYTAYVCDYIVFLNYLIDTVEDVEFLIRKGIVKRGRSAESVAEIVNKLCTGVVSFGSYYYETAERLNNHYDSRLNRTLATLQRVYFKDLWTGTATVAAVVIVVLTLIGTVASVLQVTQKDN